jgi:hypothetical protein
MNPKLALALLAFTPACGDVVEKDPEPFDTSPNTDGNTSGVTDPTETSAPGEESSPTTVDDTNDPTDDDGDSDDSDDADESTTDVDDSSSSTTGFDPEACEAFFNCSMFCEDGPACIEGCAARWDVDISACEEWRCDELSEDCFDGDLDACELFAQDCIPGETSSTGGTSTGGTGGTTTETGTDSGTTTETGTDSGTTTETGTDSGTTTETGTDSGTTTETGTDSDTGTETGTDTGGTTAGT